MTMTTALAASSETLSDRMIPDVCWVLPGGYYAGDFHFLTRDEALETVRTDGLDRWKPTTIPDAKTCASDVCILKRRLAEEARLVEQEQLAAEQVVLEQARHDEEVAYREERLRVATLGVEQAQKYYERRLELAADATSHQVDLFVAQGFQEQQVLQLAREQHDAQEAAQREQAAVGRARHLVDRAGGEIGKADAKAGVAITVELALIGATGAGTLGTDGVLRWVAIGVLLIGVLAAAWAVLPRMPRRTGAGELALNFGAIRRLDGAQLAEQLRDVDELQAMSQEAVNLAQIARHKYLRIRWSMQAGLAGLVLAIAAAVVGSW